jgi:hydrogenase expression/formation protein HypC
MCLAIPGRILSINGSIARTSFGGVERDVSLEFVSAKKGDYVLVHAGFAIEILDKTIAEEKLSAWGELKDG